MPAADSFTDTDLDSLLSDASTPATTGTDLSDSDLDNLLAEAQPRQGPSKTLDVLKGIGRGFTEGAAATPRSAALLLRESAKLPEPIRQIARFIPIPGVPGFLQSIPNETKAALLEKEAAVIQDAVPEPSEESQKSFWLGDLPRGAGSMLSFLIPGTAARVVGGAGKVVAKSAPALERMAGWLSRPATATVAATGAAANGISAYDEAIKRGASEDEAFRAFLLNAGAGTSEVVPLEGMIGRLLGPVARKWKGIVVQSLKDGVTSGLDEAIQEGSQQVAQDLIARGVYDPEREIDWEAAARSAAVGGILGHTFGTLTSALGARINRDRPEPVPAPPRQARPPVLTRDTRELQTPIPLGPPVDEPELQGEQNAGQEPIPAPLPAFTPPAPSQAVEAEIRATEEPARESQPETAQPEQKEVTPVERQKEEGQEVLKPATAAPEPEAAAEARPVLEIPLELRTPEEAGITPPEPATSPPSSEKKRFGKLGLDSPSATPEAVAKWRAEKREYRNAQKRAKERTEKSNAYWNAIEDAVKEKRPISVAASEFRYSQETPDGYARVGNVLEYRPKSLTHDPVDVADKVQNAMESVPAKTTKRNAKEIKQELVSRLEQALSKAPETESKSSITIAIPEDGTFTIRNNKSAIQNTLDAVARLKTTAKERVDHLSLGRQNAEERLAKDISDAVTIYGDIPSAYRALKGQLARASELELEESQVNRLSKVVERLSNSIDEPVAKLQRELTWEEERLEMFRKEYPKDSELITKTETGIAGLQKKLQDAETKRLAERGEDQAALSPPKTVNPAPTATPAPAIPAPVQSPIAAKEPEPSPVEPAQSQPSSVPPVIPDQETAGSVPTEQAIAPQEAITAALNDGATLILDNDWKIKKHRIAHANRIEIIGPDYTNEGELRRNGVVMGRMRGGKMHYFVLADEAAPIVIGSILKSHPVVKVEGGQQGSDIISRLESKKLDPGTDNLMLPLLPGLDPASLRAIWNTGIDVVILAVRTGRAIAEAVKSGWEYIKTELDKTGVAYDEAAVRTEYEREVATAQTPAVPPVLKQTTTQILGLDEPALRRVLGPEDREAGQRDAERLFTEAGISWVRGANNLLVPANPADVTDAELQRLIVIAQRELDPVVQARLSRNDAPPNDRRANFNNSIREWARVSRSAMMRGELSHLSRALFDQLAGIAQGQASEVGKKLYLFKEPQIDEIERIAEGPEIELLDVWSEAFDPSGGVRKTLQTIRLYFQNFFNADQINSVLAANPRARDFLEELLGDSSVSPKPTVSELIRTIFGTPIYRKTELGERLVSILTNQLNIPPDKADEAKLIFEQAFAESIEKAQARALAQAQNALTPLERKHLGAGTQLWRKLQNFVNAGGAEDYAFLKSWAMQQGWKIPTDSEIKQFRAYAVRSQRLLELTPRQRIEAGGDKAKLEAAQRARRDATLDERQMLHQKMIALWKRWTRPLKWTHWFAGTDIAYNNAQAINEWVAGNILSRLTFATKQAIDIGTASILYTPSRALAHAFLRYTNDKGNPDIARENLWKDVTEALREAYTVRNKTFGARVNALGQGLLGRGLPQNVEGVRGGTHVFDRIQKNVDELLKEGTPTARVKAFMLMIAGLGNMGFRVSGALDLLQGIPAEFQEMRQQVVTELREAGKPRGVAIQQADEVIGDIQAERTLALAEARAILNESAEQGQKITDGQVSKAAWEIVKGRMYARMKALGLPADAFEKRNNELRQLIGWNLPETGGLGGLSTKATKGLQDFLARMGIPTGGVAAFGNAIGTLVNRKLTWLGLGFLPKAFGDSPWFRYELDQLQRKAEAGAGVTVGAVVFLMAATGAIVVRVAWPDDPKEREEWEKEGTRPGMIEIPIGNGQKIQISTTAGLMSYVGPYLAAGGAYHQLVKDRAKKQEKLNAEAAARGLPPGEVEPITAAEALGVLAAAGKNAIMGGRTVSGLRGTFGDYGKFDIKKAGAAFAGSFVPLLPQYGELTRMAGVSLDPKRGSFWDLLVPMPNSTARRVNMLGDEVGNTDAIQRVLGMMTGGTSIRTKGAVRSQGLAYANLFASDYRPPVLNPGKGYDFGKLFRPMKPKEFGEYVVNRGKLFKRELEALGSIDTYTPEDARKAAQTAFQKANDEALRSVGVSVPKRARTAKAPRIKAPRKFKGLMLRTPKLRLPGSRRSSLRGGLRRQLKLRLPKRQRLPRLSLAA